MSPSYSSPTFNNHITAIIFAIKTRFVLKPILPFVSTLDTTEENIEYVTLLFLII